MSKLTKFNVNGLEIVDTNSVSIYNLGPVLLYAVDIFIYSKVASDMEWLLTNNINNSPKIQLSIDNSQAFDISKGLAGESFSNPISYNRLNDIGPNIRKIPSHNVEYQKDVALIGGSMDSSVGSNWSYRFPVPSSAADRAFQSQNPGVNSDSLTIEIIINPKTDFLMLNRVMGNAIITVAPSLYKGLEYNYLNYNSQPKFPVSIEKGIRY